MDCKNCGRALETDEMICTQCGYDNTPEEESGGKINPWKIAFPAVLCVGLLLVLGWLLFFGVNGYWIPRANDIYNKDSYTANADLLQANRNAVVATLGKNKLTNSQLQVFYYKALSDYNGQFSFSKPLDEQIYDEKRGLTWQQYLLELSLNAWKKYRILTDMALEAEFQLPAEYQESLDTLYDDMAASAEKNGISSVDEYISKVVGEGCTFADYKYFIELNYYASLYFEELAADITSTQEEIDKFFNENEETFQENGITKDSGILVDYRHIFVKVEGSLDGATIVDWDSCKYEAESILDQWLSDPTEENFSSLAADKSDDKTTGKNGGLQHYIHKDYLTNVDIRHILIMPEGGTKSADGKTTVYSDAEWEACRKKAQEIYDKYLNGEKTEENFSALAKEHSQDGNAKDGGIYTDVKKDSMVEEFDAWIFDESREPGDTGLVKTQYGYHVMYFVHRDSEQNDWLFDAQRKHGDYEVFKTDDGYQILFFVEGDEGWFRLSENALKEEKADQMLEELDEQHQMSVKYGNVRLAR